MTLDARAQAVLEFWLGPTGSETGQIPERMNDWFGADDDAAQLERRDQLVAARFGELVAAAQRGEHDAWAREPRGRLALILLLDQFPRNIGRGTPAAFASDSKALALTLEGLDARMDERLAPIESAFFLMPLQHAEDRALQDRSVIEYRRLAARVEAREREHFTNFADHAQLHRDIVARFGRFPHRNAILGRPTTDAEHEYLATDAPRFGQT
jgi:uncharacterized protein (DUF924 family)